MDKCSGKCQEAYTLCSDEDFLKSVHILEWTYAKTMPEPPHEYIIRGKTVDDEMYCTIFHTITARGILREWKGTYYKYLHPGDGYYYWTMTDDINESIIINRAEDV